MILPQDVLHESNASSLAKEEQLRMLASWLVGANTIDTYQKAVNICQPGTGTWILSREAYCNWAACRTFTTEMKPQLLWIQGPPGCGKTILCAQVVENLKSSLLGDSTYLAIFFCSSEQKDRRNTIVVLRSWIEQLAQVDEQVLKVVYEVYSSRTTKFPTELELWEIWSG